MSMGHRVVAAPIAAGIDPLVAQPFAVFVQDGILGLHQFGVRQGVGKVAEEGLVGRLAVEPIERRLVNEVGRVLLAQFITGSPHGVPDILVERDPHRGRVAQSRVVAVQEVGIVEVRLKLADVTEELVDPTLVGGRDRTFVTAGPLAEHTGRVAIVLHHLGQDHMIGVVGVLSYHGIVGIDAITHLAALGPILLVATHLAVSRVLPRHDAGPRRGAHGTARIGLGKPHALRGHAVEIGSLDISLSVTPQVTIAHVVAQDKNNVGFVALLRQYREGSSQQPASHT